MNFDFTCQLPPTPPSPSFLFGNEPRTKSLDMRPLVKALSSKSYKEVVENTHLFWLAFCKALAEAPKSEPFAPFSFSLPSSCPFSITLEGMELQITSTKVSSLSFQNSIEEIRKIFAKSCAAKSSSFFVLPIEHEYSCLVREPSDIIDLTKFFEGSRYRLTAAWFESIIRPTMQPLCKSIGALSSEVTVTQKIKNKMVIRNEDVKAFKIEWDSSDHFVYSIPPKTFARRDSLEESMYSMYKSQVLCDFSLIAKDGSLKDPLKVHSILLFTFGGNMLTKESTEKFIYFSNYSLNTVKAFVDFIYLGDKGLELEYVLKNSVDLCELLDMAHVYQIQPLVDCCTNLLILSSSINDIKKIKKLADKYDNEHLKELHSHLLAKFDDQKKVVHLENDFPMGENTSRSSSPDRE